MLSTFKPIRIGEVPKDEPKLNHEYFDDTRGQFCLITPDLSSDEIVSYRKSLGMTQQQFAEEFSIPLGTLRRWEQGQNKPQLTEAARTLFARIFMHKAKNC